MLIIIYCLITHWNKDFFTHWELFCVQRRTILTRTPFYTCAPGGQRWFSRDRMESQDSNQSPYVKELKDELNKIDSDDFVHATRLLTEGKT